MALKAFYTTGVRNSKAVPVEDPVFSGDKWRHSGFNVFFGPRILLRQEKSMASGSASLRGVG
jgi:hypothetical protein